MTRRAMAAEFFNNNFTCSQAVAVAFAQQYGLDSDTVLKLSRGLGGGMGGMGGTCGAVTGAYLAIGMAYDAADPAAKGQVYAKVQEFERKFKERHGVTECRNLLGCDISSAAGKALMQEKKLRETHCAVFVQDAVTIAEEILSLDRENQ